MSAHGRAGRDRAGPGQARSQARLSSAGPLLVIAMALIGGLAAATLVDASLLIAVIVSVVIGAVGAVVVLRSPARAPELTAPAHGHHAACPPRPAPSSRAAPPPELLPARPGRPGHAPRLRLRAPTG